MKRKRFLVEQIVAVLKQAELGMALSDLVRQVGSRTKPFFALGSSIPEPAVSSLARSPA